MEYLLAYLIAGVVLAWAADRHTPAPTWQIIAVIIFWLPATIVMGWLAGRK